MAGFGATAAAAATPAVSLRAVRQFQTSLRPRCYGGRKQKPLRRGNVAVAVAEDNKARVSSDKDGSLTFSFGDAPDTECTPAVEASNGSGAATPAAAEESLTTEASHTAGSASDMGDYRVSRAMPSEQHRGGVFNGSQGGNGAVHHRRSMEAACGSDTAIAEKVVSGHVDSAHGSISAIPIPVLSYRHAGTPLKRSAPPPVMKHQQEQEQDSPLTRYRQACKQGDILDALSAVEDASLRNDTLALTSFIHKDFLRLAGKRRAVSEAFHFVELLPNYVADRRTFNMLITVCAQAADLPSALKAASLLQEQGLSLDDSHYTNIMKAAAAAADADAAFKLYSEMRREGLKPSAMTITTLIDACAREIMQRSVYSKDRRTKLVLTERAFQVFSDGLATGVKADVPMWNALLNVAGYSGKLDQALAVMENMQISGVRPNDRTFSTLIAACNRAGQPDMCLEVFGQAMRQGVTESLMVYFAAAEACTSTKQGPDIDAAMTIYNEMKRNRVMPTTQLYSSMIKIAGLAGKLDLALDLQDEMLEEGLAPDDSSYAAVINACVQNGDIETAEQIYSTLRAAGGSRLPHAFNAMINAYAQAFNIGNAGMVLEDMVKAGVTLDRHTYGSLIKACQRCGESDLAFLVYRLMRNQNFALDQATAFTLIRACFNHIRSLWRPGGYPPARVGSYTMAGTAPAAASLLKALNCPPQTIAAWREKPDMTIEDWQKRALNIYREYISTDHPFSVRILDIVLGCLRQPLPQDGEGPAAHSGLLGLGMPLSNAHQSLGFRAGSTDFGFQNGGTSAQSSGSEAKKIKSIEILFDSRAVSLVEEAVTTGNLPQMTLDPEAKCLINLRGLPPAVAEVYVLAMFRSLERKATVRFRYRGELKILVPPYNPTVLFVPSYDDDGNKEPQNHANHTDDDSGSALLSLNPSVGLAVAAQLRRLKMFSYSAPDDGVITVRGKEITRWIRSRIRSTMHQNKALAGNGVPTLQPQHRSFGSLTHQQRQIRTDIG
mmetsp:Transcript_2657/g.6586  ORF Transcript_2657/g.6586 Transcript_2657/m.6586 type:complete len:1003 (-) Transcript_2657:90-3098(-)